MYFDGSPFAHSCEGRKSLRDFKFGAFIGRFPSGGAASMAVKVLKTVLIRDNVVMLSCLSR